MGSGHTVFANRSGHVSNRGINVQTDTNQDQGCEGVGGTSGITNACTATSGRGPTETSTTTETPVTLAFAECAAGTNQFNCAVILPGTAGCNNLGCQIVFCVGSLSNVSHCTTDNGIQLTSCTVTERFVFNFSCLTPVTQTRTVPGTGTTNSGGVSG